MPIWKPPPLLLRIPYWTIARNCSGLRPLGGTGNGTWTVHSVRAGKFTEHRTLIPPSLMSMVRTAKGGRPVKCSSACTLSMRRGSVRRSLPAVFCGVVLMIFRPWCPPACGRWCFDFESVRGHRGLTAQRVAYLLSVSALEPQTVLTVWHHGNNSGYIRVTHPLPPAWSRWQQPARFAGQVTTRQRRPPQQHGGRTGSRSVDSAQWQRARARRYRAYSSRAESPGYSECCSKSPR